MRLRSRECAELKRYPAGSTFAHASRWSQRLFVPNGELEAGVQDLASKLPQPFLGVHVRRGDKAVEGAVHVENEHVAATLEAAAREFSCTHVALLSDDPAAAAAIQQHSRTVTITAVDRMIPTSAFGLLSAVLALARHATALLGHSTSNMFRWMLQMSYQATYSNLG